MEIIAAMRSTTRTVASILGIIAGLLGMEHGYFETLQGPITPDSILISAFGSPCQPKVVWHACEPAMTVIPNFLVTGIAAIVVSLIVLLWAAAFVQRKHGGSILILLSILQLLVGGGFVSPFYGIIAGAAGTWITSPLTWWHAHLSGTPLHVLAAFGIGPIIVILVWLPAEWILGHFFNEFMLSLAMPLFVFNLALVLLAVVAGLARDIMRNQPDARPELSTSR
jgi:hypothetical protein